MKARPVLDQKDIKGGCTYLNFVHLGSYRSFSVVTITKKSYKNEVTDSWFIRAKAYYGPSKYSDGFVCDTTFSLTDSNVHPNSYNDHSLWNNDSKSRKFLESVIADEDGASDLYLEILSRFKRGKSHANQQSLLKKHNKKL